MCSLLTEFVEAALMLNGVVVFELKMPNEYVILFNGDCHLLHAPPDVHIFLSVVKEH